MPSFFVPSKPHVGGRPEQFSFLLLPSSFTRGYSRFPSPVTETGSPCVARLASDSGHLALDTGVLGTSWAYFLPLSSEPWLYTLPSHSNIYIPFKRPFFSVIRLMPVSVVKHRPIELSTLLAATNYRLFSSPCSLRYVPSSWLLPALSQEWVVLCFFNPWPFPLP